MRVAYVSTDPGVPVFGCKGCSVHVQGMLRALVQHGDQVDLFARRFDGDPPRDLRAVRIHRLAPLGKSSSAEREQRLLAANRELAQRLADESPYDLIYERHALWSHAAMEHAWSAGAVGLLEVNAPLVEEQAQYRQLFDRDAAERAARWAMRAATVIVAVSEELAARLDRLPEAVGRVHAVSNGVDPDRFEIGALRRGCTGRTAYRVGFVGTLKPWHGIPTLLDAFARLHGQVNTSRLLIVGDGPGRDELLSVLNAFPTSLREAVEWTGAVQPAKIPGLLASMDVAVAPYGESDDFYFSPLKVYEYMAAGLPVIVSRVGELRRLIEHGRSGLSCPPGDAVALAEQLIRLHRDPVLRGKLGDAGRAVVMERHTWRAKLEQILELAGRRPVVAEACEEAGR
ncbi:MAG: glycosyltransferase family 4 protein [Pirellulales bacterium]